MSFPDYSTLRALAQQATPGPWEAPERLLGRECTTVFAGGDTLCWLDSRADAAYIAAMSPTVLTTILDEVELLDRVARRNNRMLDDAKAQLAEAQAETRVVAAQRNTRGEAVIRLTAERDALAAQIERVRALVVGVTHPYPRDRSTADHYVRLVDDIVTALDAAQTGEPT